MVEIRVRNPLKLIGKRVRLLRRQVEAERFDRDEAIARRLVRPEDRPENAASDLMQNPEWPERRRR